MGLSPGYIAAKNAAIQFETETLSEYGGAPYPVQNASSGASHWSQLVTVKGGFGGQAGQAIQTGLNNLWNTDEGKDVIVSAAQRLGNKIIIDPDPKNGSALAIGNHVVLPAHTFSLRYKGEDGAMHDFTVERTLLHEIAHFAFGRNEELTVDIVNAVMEYRFGEEPRYKYGKFNDGLSDNRGTPHYDSAQPASSGYGHQQQYQSAEPRRSVQDFRSGSNEIDQFGRFRMEGFDDSTTRRMVDILQHQNPNFGPEVTIQYTGNGAFGINPHQKLIQINQQILDRPGNLERNLPGALRQLGSPHSSLDMGGGDEIAALDGFDEDAPQIDVHEEGLLHLRQFDLAGDSLYSGDVGLLEETQAFYPAVIAALSPDIVMDSQAPDVTLSSNPGFSGV